MSATYTYETILRAIGKVLDQADVKSFNIQETDDGLLVQGLDQNGSPIIDATLSPADLHELLSSLSDTADMEPAMQQSDGTSKLRRLIAKFDMELVGASR